MLTPAICTQCGANIEVDASKEAGICKFCGTAFITEKAINNYVTNHNTVHNVTENVTKIIYGNEKDEGSDFFKRGVTMLKISKFKDARKAFKKATSLSPEKAVYWFYLAAAHTENFKSVEKGFDNEEDSSEYGLTPCFDALYSFYALATDDEKEQLSEEFGINFAGGPSFVLAKLIENLKSSDKELHNSLMYLSIFAGTKYGTASSQKLLKTPEAANAFADLIINSKLGWREDSFALEIYNLCADYMDKRTSADFKKSFGDSLNKVINGTLEIKNLDMLKDGEYENGTLAIRRPEVSCVKFSSVAMATIDRFIITENITGKCFLKARVVEFEYVADKEIIIHAASAIACEMLILPPLCPTIETSISTLTYRSLIIFSNTEYKNKLSAFNYVDGSAKYYRYGSVINGKITYPEDPNKTTLNEFNKNLRKYFGNEIDSGKITGYLEDPKPATRNGCYVATCVYGSYDCEQVWTLRRYRDQKLRSSLFGRAFIKLYYAISPTVVKLFGKTALFNRFFRKRLDKMVKKLQNEGYESTPYID